MVYGWRAVGFTYLDYSTIAAKWMRKSLKGRKTEEVIKRDNPAVKLVHYKDGVPNVGK